MENNEYSGKAVPRGQSWHPFCPGEVGGLFSPSAPKRVRFQERPGGRVKWEDEH